jgi:hypothetical protein
MIRYPNSFTGALEKYLDGVMMPVQETFRVIRAVRVSHDHGEHWKLCALCEKCWTELEPPTRRKLEALASVRRCDWCGCRNFQDLPEEKREQFYPPCEPIFTADMNNEAEMEQLKSVLGAGALTEAFETFGPDEAIVKIAEKCRAAMANRTATTSADGETSDSRNT